ncbi:hypothetical protein HPB49_008881 [Dermacentor silvarum]|uniref:Uncharacterized protein n=1 Tax=Dermacentor silvarum TaxID=543639 RepID=A0ACB8C8F6_DERSI|nr:hypothetical protein HPB49_008881 [Dermacentor silvarum]
MARLEEMAATTHTGHDHAQPVTLRKLMLDVPTFSGHNAGKLVTNFLDDLAHYRTVAGVWELDLLKRVLPVALRGTAAQWPRLQPPFLSWYQFVAAFKSGVPASALRVRWQEIRRELDNRTQHPDEGLRAYVRAMQDRFRRADPSATESTNVSHVLRRCHHRFTLYLFGRSFSSLEELAGSARQITETLFSEQHYAPTPPVDFALEPACA